MGSSKDSEKTIAKLIEAAGQLFSNKGFKGVTVRDIAHEAEVPLSAINYHFRTKEMLYREVLLEACKTNSISPKEQEQLLKLEPRESLFILVNESLKANNQQKMPIWQSVILAREYWAPSQVFEEVVLNYWEPQTNFLLNVIGTAVGKASSEKQVRFAGICLICLIDTFSHYGQFIESITPGLEKEFPKNDWLVCQIVRVVLDAANGEEENS